MKTLYLCGAINGCTDAECKEWREAAKDSRLKAKFSFLDPMVRDYRGKEAVSAAAIVNGDYYDVRRADALLVNGNKGGWGTAMEVKEAFDSRRKLVVAFCECDADPWLMMHSHFIAKSLEDAIAFLLLE